MLSEWLAIAVPVVTIVAWLFYGIRPSPSSASVFRGVAIGVAGLLLPWTMIQAVAAERLLLGLGAAVLLRETATVIGPVRIPGALLRLADTLVWAVPLIVFAPYASMAAYFFGYDRAVFALTGVTVLVYVLAVQRSPAGRARLAEVLLLLVSLLLSLWPLWARYTG